jgi:hypothetical protein
MPPAAVEHAGAKEEKQESLPTPTPKTTSPSSERACSPIICRRSWTATAEDLSIGKRIANLSSSDLYASHHYVGNEQTEETKFTQVDRTLETRSCIRRTHQTSFIPPPMRAPPAQNSSATIETNDGSNPNPRLPKTTLDSRAVQAGRRSACSHPSPMPETNRRQRDRRRRQKSLLCRLRPL